MILVIICLAFLNLLWFSEDKINEQKITLKHDNYDPYVNFNGVNSKFIELTVHQDRIFPYTIYANKGDNIVLSFGATNITDFFIEDYDINEKIKLSNINFVADKSGAFEYYCLNCDHKLPGLLIVN